jgi:hypothetical protein
MQKRCFPIPWLLIAGEKFQVLPTGIDILIQLSDDFSGCFSWLKFGLKEMLRFADR